MPRLSDLIEEFIKEMIQENKDSELEIKRNELANQFSCAPSQINYVLTTRFTVDQGYFIESKRGGGGCIRIKRIVLNQNKSFLNVLNEKIGNSITYDGAIKIIGYLTEVCIISGREANIIKAAVNDRSLSYCLEYRNEMRADILKATIMSLFV